MDTKLFVTVKKAVKSNPHSALAQALERAMQKARNKTHVKKVYDNPYLKRIAA